MTDDDNGDHVKQTQPAEPTREQLYELIRVYHESEDVENDPNAGMGSVLPETILTLLPSIKSVRQQRDPLIWLRLFHSVTDSDWLVAGADRRGNDWLLWLYATLGGNDDLAEWGCELLSELDRVKPFRVSYDVIFSPVTFARRIPRRRR